MTQKKPNIFLAAAFVMLGTGMFYFSEGGVDIGSFNLMTKYVIAIVIVGSGLFAFLVVPDLNEFLYILKDSFFLALPYLVTLLFSMPIWILRNSSLSNITRGAAFTLYQLLGLMAAIAYTIAFQDKAIYVQITSMVIANIVICLKSAAKIGIGTFISEYVTLMKTFGETTSTAMVEVEVHDLTFAFGIYLLYFIMHKENVKKKLFMILVCGLFFTIGLKRIAVAALIPVLVMIFLTNLIKKVFSEKSSIRFLKLSGILVLVVGIGYIIVIKFGLYNTVADMLNIDTKGRTELNVAIDPYYSLSPFFMGYGLGYVSRMMASASVKEFGGILALHNDYLRLYIELGFWGYLVWLWVSWKSKISYFCNKRGSFTAMVVFMVYLYCFITYMTDNTYYYFYTNIATFTTALSCKYEKKYTE